MKFKITCSPRARSSVTKKFISSSLVAGLLLNTTLSSLAGALSEDGRYESFEGDSITIDNILEEDKVDVEIEGNTMVNVANQKGAIPITKSYTVEGANHISLEGDYDGEARPVIEGNTMYYNNDTGELTDTFVEGANLSLVSSFEDQLVTQDMVNSGKEKAGNLGKYKVEYKVTGKNKLDLGAIFTNAITRNGITISYTDGELSVTGTSTSTNSTGYENIGISFSKADILFEEGVTYTLQSTAALPSGIMNFGFKQSGGDILTTNKSNACMTADKISSINQFVFFIKNGETINFKTKIQIEEGSTATEYEPYKESIKTFYLNSPLLKGDTIEDVNGKATHVRRYNKIVLDGSEEWRNGYISTNTMQFVLQSNNAKSGAICYNDRFQYIHPTLYETDVEMFHINSAPSFVIGISKSKLSTQDINGLKQWLQQNPVTVIYELASPIYETISEESILIDSYKDGHLDLNSNMPVNKVGFTPTTTNLNYLYPSTEYTVQFESNNVGKLDKILLGDETLYTNYSVSKGVNRFNITISGEVSSTELKLDGIGFNLSNLVVTEATSGSFDYFEGIQSVGEDDINGHNIEIKANNKNLFDGKYELGYIHVDDGYISVPNATGLTTEWIKCKPNTKYIASGGDRNRWILRNSQGEETIIGGITGNETPRITTLSDTVELRCYFKWTSSSESIEDVLNKFQIEEGTVATSYTSGLSNNTEIPLSEPLRSLPNGVRDKIIKRNGQWVVERNCEEVTLDGSENWEWAYNGDDDGNTTMLFALKINKILFDGNFNTQHPIYTNNFKTDASILSSKNREIETCTGFSFTNYGYLDFRILKSKLSTEDVKGFKQWLSENPTTVIYQLAEPIYEPLNIESTINLYLETTHISNSSNIPANIKVTVDRTMNKAVEAIESAENNPTSENLSNARYWTNLLRESAKKDELQSSVNDIVGVADIELERKTVSSNLDVYVKSENMLSMSLDTNSVNFENYSGVEDMEMKDAVNITINSSLPYNLNAYMSNNISSNSSNEMDKDVLNIKDSSEEEYQHFDSNINKLVLKNNCAEGNNNQHSIDLKLASNNAHKADVYKTVIKFEAEQK